MNSAKNYIKSQENKKSKKVKEKETWLAIQKVTNRMGLVFPVIVFCIFAFIFIEISVYG